MSIQYPLLYFIVTTYCNLNISSSRVIRIYPWIWKPIHFVVIRNYPLLTNKFKVNRKFELRIVSIRGVDSPMFIFGKALQSRKYKRSGKYSIFWRCNIPSSIHVLYGIDLIASWLKSIYSELFAVDICILNVLLFTHWKNDANKK